MARAVMDTNGDMLEYRHLMKRPDYTEIWRHSYGDETGRPAQGLKGRVKSTNTMYLIHKDKVPQYCFKNSTYGEINCRYREGKAEPNRARLTEEGDRIN